MHLAARLLALGPRLPAFWPFAYPPAKALALAHRQRQSPRFRPFPPSAFVSSLDADATGRRPPMVIMNPFILFCYLPPAVYQRPTRYCLSAKSVNVIHRMQCFIPHPLLNADPSRRPS